MKNKFLLGGGILLFLLVLVVGTAYADTNGGVINACVKDNGQVRIVNQASDCKNQETYIYWNIVGPQGPKGDTGATGLQGAQGLQGPKGDKGDAGETGAIGPQGLQGEKGDKGDTGVTGAIGPQGLQGEKGDKGDTGATGVIGPQGLQGEKGDKGDTGAVGLTGEQGPQGEPGNLALAGQMCPAGQYVIGFNANGGIVCAEAFLPTETPVPTETPTEVPPACDVPAWADPEAVTIAAMLNDVRQQAGLACLTFNLELTQAAGAHANYMMLNGPEGNPHQELSNFPGYTGDNFLDRAVVAGYPDGSAAAEFVGWGVTSEAQIAQMWIDYPQYAPLIITPGYQAIGIGHEGDYWDAMFGTTP
jgi:uncharacterized protein YkwD